MASVFTRKNADGSITYRVMIRRKGIPPIITSFCSKEEADEFVKNNEAPYVLGHKNLVVDHLRTKRKNEFDRRKKKGA